MKNICEYELNLIDPYNFYCICQYDLHWLLCIVFWGPSVIKDVNADPGGCMCIMYFLDSKCEQTQLLELPHRLAHFFARSHHCHQALAMINNATMIHWQIELCYGHLPIQFWWPRHWGYSFSCKMVVEWQIYVQPWLHFLSLRWMSEGQENILLDNRALIQIWIWWWRNCNQNCRSLKQDHNFLPWIKR